MKGIDTIIEKALSLKAKGLTDKEIGDELHLSPNTISWLLTRKVKGEKPPTDVKIGWRSVGVYPHRIENLSIIMSDIIQEEMVKQKEELDNKKSLSSAQMRRFFSEFRQLEKKVKTLGFDRVKPLIKMVKSKASYAANRPTPIPKTFKDFLVNNINGINSKEDFEAFMLHFEAVVGFFYGIPGVRNN